MVKKFKQLFRHDPENGVYGDCYRTAIGCIMGLSPDRVPHFCDGPDDELMQAKIREFLGPLGLVLIEVPFSGEGIDLPLIMQIGEARSEGLPYLLTGMSSIGSNHVVVCQADKIIHDPSLDDTGIVGPTRAGNWWIGWVVGKSHLEESAGA